MNTKSFLSTTKRLIIEKKVKKVSKRDIYEQKTEELVIPIIESNRFELIDVEYIKELGNWYLRIYIDKLGGITVDDCEIVSRALGDELDEKDFIEDAYILEVSSPGLGRPLKKEKDLERHLGAEVDVKTYKPIEKQKEFNGILEAYDKDSISLRFDEENTMRLLRADIALIRLAINF